MTSVIKFLLSLHEPCPVSYTHLDVYKRQGIGILADGVADAKGIDTAMKLGANHPIGPLELGDLVGLDIVLAIMETLYN